MIVDWTNYWWKRWPDGSWAEIKRQPDGFYFIIFHTTGLLHRSKRSDAERTWKEAKATAGLMHRNYIHELRRFY